MINPWHKNAFQLLVDKIEKQVIESYLQLIYTYLSICDTWYVIYVYFNN